MLLTQNHQLMGPQHPGYTAVQNTQWQFPQTANTSSIKYFGFRDGSPDLAWASWTLVWQPNSNGTSKARLIAMDTGGPGYGTWEEVVVLDGQANSGPTPQGVLIGEAWYRWAQSRVDKYVGFQVRGDNRTESTIWESRLMVEFSISSSYLLSSALGLRSKSKFLNARPPIDLKALEMLKAA